MKFLTTAIAILILSLSLSACSPQPATPSTDQEVGFGAEDPDSKKIEDLSGQQTVGQSATQTPNQPTGEKTMTQDTQAGLINAHSATITTSKGAIEIELYPEKTPITVDNFAKLAKSGFYDGIRFHRIIADFMAQVGDPLTKDESKKNLWGTGGPGYTIADEFVAELKHDTRGIVSMANTGQPHTGGSQFFITFEPTPWLDGKHTVFGKVTSGMEVVDQLQIGDAITKIEIKE